MATGRELLGPTIPHALRVWSWNLEDPRDEIDRRIQAACLHYRITEQEIGGRLHISSGRDQPCIIAQMDRAGAYIVQPVADKIISELREKWIDVLRVDPFVSSHRVTENNNEQIDLVAKQWGFIADEANCAIDLTHHTRKLGGEEANDESARGASSLGNALRVVRVLNRMTKEEGERAGIENPRQYFRGFNEKANLAPPAEVSDWYRLESIDLGNGPPSDHVGVVVPWTWPDAFDGIAPGSLFAVQKLIAGGSWKENSQAKNWAGIAVAQVLELDISRTDHKTRSRTILNSWIKGRAFKIVRHLDDARHECPFVEVDQWSTP